MKPPNISKEDCEFIIEQSDQDAFEYGYKLTTYGSYKPGTNMGKDHFIVYQRFGPTKCNAGLQINNKQLIKYQRSSKLKKINNINEGKM